jgi:hypothetical protein
LNARRKSGLADECTDDEEEIKYPQSLNAHEKERAFTVHSQKQAKKEPEVGEKAQNWRISVNLERGLWRFENGGRNGRKWTKYFKLKTLPGGEGRLNNARRRSEKQKAGIARNTKKRGS